MDRAPHDPASPGSLARLGRWVAQERWLLILMLLTLALGGVAGYRYGVYTRAAAGVEAQAEMAGRQAAALSQLDAEKRFLRAQLDTADGELAVERAARTELEQQLRNAQAELGRVRDRLAFYEQLLPPGPQGSLDIRALEVERRGNGLRYRVLLMRNSGGSAAAFDGSLQFMATGVQRGRTVTLELVPMQVRADGSAAASDDIGKGLLAVHFDQYQRSQGVLEIPPGFVPESVTLRVLEAGAVRATRTVPLEL